MGILRRIWPNVGRDLLYNTLIASPIVPLPGRWILLRLAGMKIGRSRVCPNVWFGSNNIEIGEGTFINYRCVFNTQGGITIGKNCDIAMDVTFVTSSHEMGTSSRRAGQPISRPISVGDGVWIGARAIVLPGVTIGNGVIVAAGSVVTSDCAENTLYAGCPATARRSLSEVSLNV
jgi:maltose O-acetyltransferase